MLLVPLRVDALRLGKSLSTVGPRVDFTRMPYWNGQWEANPNVANISEALISHPFQDRGFFLPVGTHLHWALPSSLTRALAPDHGGRTTFPAVPNRWLVTRSQTARGGPAAIEEQWIVESDYVFPERGAEPPGATAIPFPANGRRRPFAFLGRQLPFSDCWKEPPPDEHLAGMGYRLTAVGYEPSEKATGGAPGYAEPTFAAFFPNCYSVFGCHDPRPPDNSKGVRYEIIGWYSKDNWDPLKARALSDTLSRIAEANPKASREELERRALREAYGFHVDDRLPASQRRTVCYARIEMRTGATVCPEMPDIPVHVAVGNTATEALSAHLADQLAVSCKTTVSRLEEQLEALHVAPRLEGISIRDLGPKFKEARHDRGFSRIAGGTTWTVRRVGPSADTTKPGDDRLGTALPHDISAQLDALNTVRAYDRATSELDSMQRQLFADWYKYMLCSYPPSDSRGDYQPADEVRFFIEKNDLAGIGQKREACATLVRQRNDMKRALRAVLDSLPKQTDERYDITERPGPRFYKPHEPVLLIVADGLEPTERHSQGTAVPCAVLHLDEPDPVDWTPRVREALDKLTADVQLGEPSATSRGFHIWDDQPWHPFALEWSVEVSPLKRGNNLDPSTRRYSEGFIESNHQFDNDGVDLTLLSGAGEVETAASIYTGSAILTPHAKFQLVERMCAYLSRRLLKTYFERQSVPPEERTDDYLEQHLAAVIAWYREHSAIHDSVLDTMLNVLAHVNSEGFHALGQTLTGFNDALLMRRQTFQLPIDEPLGFDDGRRFTEKVREAVGGNSRSAPQPLDDFHPIRTGEFQILALRLVDTFGRVQRLTLASGKATTTEVFTHPEQPHLIALPPRLVQAARLNFRWLSGASTGPQPEEMTSHPVTSSILGWLVPNHLDKSLMVYGPSGAALGSLTKDGAWASRPGSAKPVEEIAGPLGTMVKHLHATDKGAVASFFDKLAAALEVIDPKSYAEHDALALLMGRPIAVVRATLSLEFRGAPAVNQGWAAFGRDLERDIGQASEGTASTGTAVRETDGVTRVRFPVLLGDSTQSNDGLIGLWRESAEGYGQFKTGSECRLSLTPGGPPAIVTMLIDPRAAVHAKTGVLPTKAIDIPREHYAHALRSMRVTFLAAPILSPVPVEPAADSPAKVEISLPGEAGYAWSWVTAHPEAADIVPANPAATWGKPVEILEGWLTLEKTAD